MGVKELVCFNILPFIELVNDMSLFHLQHPAGHNATGTVTSRKRSEVNEEILFILFDSWVHTGLLLPMTRAPAISQRL